MENFAFKHNELENNKTKFENALVEVKGITDKLGKGIDGGIIELVAIIHTMSLQTSSSCSGHTEYEKLSQPYVEFYTQPPHGWTKDKKNSELREHWRQTNFEQRITIEPLIAEFNRTRDVSLDAKLKIIDIGVYGGFRIMNTGGLESPSVEKKIEKIEQYQNEMSEFQNS